MLNSEYRSARRRLHWGSTRHPPTRFGTASDIATSLRTSNDIQLSDPASKDSIYVCDVARVANTEKAGDNPSGESTSLALMSKIRVVRVGLERAAKRGAEVSDAMRLVVDGFVSLKDRIALEEMRAHRQKLRGDLQQRAGGLGIMNYSLQIIDADLQAIEDGFARLQT
jgi:hypothetical protein